MIILGIAAEHNSSATLMQDGKILGIVQEERLTKNKNQCAFPLLAIKELINDHLKGNYQLIDRVVYGSIKSDPYFTAMNFYSGYSVEEQIKDMKNYWYQKYYKKKKITNSYWKNKYKKKINLNKNHNYDLSFLLKKMTYEEEINYFSSIERKSVVTKYFSKLKKISFVDHHTCHAYYALYGGELNEKKFKDTLVVTADAYGDNKNWSISSVNRNGTLKKIASGNNFTVARIYKFCTLILGMKPNEHEYKVMGLSSYSNSYYHIEKAERIFFDILDFKEGSFKSKKPLIDSYFDLKMRLEGHRFDNIAAALQNWSSKVTLKWIEYWLKKTKKKGIAFSGGLSMNIKANGDIMNSPMVNWLSIPASGGDESLCVGACYYYAIRNKVKAKAMKDPYLGSASTLNNNCFDKLKDTNMNKDDFLLIKNFSNKKAAKLLARDEILARCIGRAEFGARALGNRSIIANPKNTDNIKKINDLIKNRDFWMPFTPSILSEKANLFLKNDKNIISPYMTIGFETKDYAIQNIKACLHPGDNTARPQFVKKNYNRAYWDLINEFYILTKIPCLLNTSLNLHGEPMNYTISDAVRTLALSSLDFLLLPNDTLLAKKKAKNKLRKII